MRTRSATHIKVFQSHIIAFFSKKSFFPENKVFSTYYTFFFTKKYKQKKGFSTYYAFFYKKIRHFFFTFYILFRFLMSAAHKLSLIMIQTHIIVVMFSIFYINLCFIMVKTRYHQMRQIINIVIVHLFVI